MFHVDIMPIATYFLYTLSYFYAFSGTNLLTRCHSARSMFSAVFGFRKALKEISAKLETSEPGIIFGKHAFLKTEDGTKAGPEGPTSPAGAAPNAVAPGGGVAPSGAHRPRSFAYKYPLDLKPLDG